MNARISIAIAFVAVLAVSFAVAQRQRRSQAAKQTERHILYYVDPMHPSYKSDKPGIAPDCGMQLQPVFSGETAGMMASPASTPLPSGAVNIDAATQQSTGIRIAPVERTTANRSLRVAGRIVAEDTRIYRINSGVDGFIRDTYSDSVGTIVTKNQKLAAYYAPEFIAAASGFLAANERVPGSVTNEGARSLQNYKDRLRNLGMSDPQIGHITETKQLPESIDVVAPATGVILARNISPGQHFEHGMEFYRVADLSRVWVIAEVYQQDQQYLRPGVLAQIGLGDDGRRWPARVTNSLPQSDEAGRTVKVRLEVDNPKLTLRPDMLVDVEIPVRLPPTITVPLDALIDSGSHARVYVQRSPEVLEPREVQTGWRTTDTVEILKGLQPGERVVIAAAFLVDSESRLQAGAPVAARR